MARKIVTYIPLTMVCLVAIASLSFSEVKRAGAVCTDVKISIEKNATHADFLIEDDIFTAIQSNRSSLIGSEIAGINTNTFEETLRANPLVLSCETYFTLNGTLCIDIKQRQPIVRIVSGKNDFYLDESGHIMPLSSRAAARVVVASGEIDVDYELGENIFQKNDAKTLQEIYTLTKMIRADELLLPLIEQIDVTPTHEFVLGTKIGPSVIEFGTIDNSQEKIRHLKAFYRSEKVRENWSQYKSISLKFKNQIVCTKIK